MQTSFARTIRHTTKNMSWRTVFDARTPGYGLNTALVLRNTGKWKHSRRVCVPFVVSGINIKVSMLITVILVMSCVVYCVARVIPA